MLKKYKANKEELDAIPFAQGSEALKTMALIQDIK
jgi:hypothetical protein